MSSAKTFVGNPLTLISIFAATAEASGAACLPFLNEHTQQVFVWFLMLFPTLLICLFFATLNLNHRVLYAPSDYRDEQNFMGGFKPASTDALVEKTLRSAPDSHNRELTEDEYMAATATEPQEIPADEGAIAVPDTLDTNGAPREPATRSEHLLLEDLALNRLSEELNVPLARNQTPVGHPKMIFAAAGASQTSIYAVEVKQANILSHPRNLVEFLKIANAYYTDLDAKLKPRFTFIILAVSVNPINSSLRDLITGYFNAYASAYTFHAKLVFYDRRNLGNILF